MKKLFSLCMICLLAVSAMAQRAAVMEFKAGVDITQADVDGISGIFTTYFRPAGYTMIERTQIDRIIDEQQLQRSTLTESQMVRVGQLLNLSKIVIGDVNIVMGQYNVDVRVINVESGFDKKAISDKGAVGLMQLMPKTALFVSGMLGENLEANSLINSDTNIRLGCKYLMYLGEKFEDEKTVLACYNAGEGAVKRWLSDSRYSDDGKTLKYIPYAQTREYVEKVLHGKEIYKSKL